MAGAPPTPAPWGAPRSKVVRWGIGDVLITWVAGLLVSAVAAAVAAAALGVDSANVADDTTVLAVAVLAQFGAMSGLMLGISRMKGTGSLRRDFGLVVHASDWTWVLRGVALQVLISIALLPIALVSDERQSVVEDIDKAGGVRLLLLAVTALVLAPVVEELLFRGLLLRSLARRMAPIPAIAVSALAFAAAHPLLDPGALPVVPGLVVLGCISGVAALRSGSLSRSILLHVGFNTIAVILALTS